MAKEQKNLDKKKRRIKNSSRIKLVVDESKGMVFNSEEELIEFFEETIEKIEKLWSEVYDKEQDFTEKEEEELESHLEDALSEPDEIWKTTEWNSFFPLFIFIKEFQLKKKSFFYIVVTYLDQVENMPTFVLSHFPTQHDKMLAAFRRGEKLFDINIENLKSASVEGDALGEGDSLAVGLFKSMMILRSEKDVPQSDFLVYANLREECIEHPDEIWKKTTVEGQGLVTFIKEFSDHELKDLHYVAVTLEDPQSQVHTLLFSFPTTDEHLLDRYRQGENLQAEEVVQESSH